MGRPKRSAPGGWISHVLNRANAGMPIFTKDEAFIAFETLQEEAVARTGTRLLSYCLMGKHGHLVLWPQEDGELSRFVGWLTEVLPVSGTGDSLILSHRKDHEDGSEEDSIEVKRHTSALHR